MLKIITYPNPILEKQAELVTFPLDNSTKNLISQMWETVRSMGAGLAAPQVGVSKQICIVHLSKTEKGKNARDILLINPKITFFSQVQYEMVEGCLSFPEEYYKIVRPANIIVEYMDERGKKKKLKAGSWLSRVIQHEVDHLNGKVFTKLGGIKLDGDEIENKEDIID